MDIVILLLITLLLYLLPQNKEYLNVKSTSGLRGFLALGIIFHHISPLVKTGEEFSNFSYMGTYIVSIFFFLSAYGLYVQNESRENYLDNFLVKRLSKIIVPFFIISLIYMFYRFVNGQLIDLNFFINLFKQGSTIIYNGWFVDIIILMYIFFYLSFKFFQNKFLSIVFNTIFIICYICLAIKLGYNFWWYNSVLAFAIGLIWAKNQNKIDRFLEKYYFIVIVLVTVLLFVSHRYDILLKYLHIEDSYSYALAANLDNIIFTIYFIIVFLKKINFSNVYLNLIGRISFELYMIHGLVISMLAKIFVSSRVNDVLFTLFVLIISLILAWIVNKIDKRIIQKVSLIQNQ
ncbi:MULTISPECIES: acyltransferase [unclassified Streptococcus]|mgnify:FL=1|jgi:putative acyltransferase|uniref:acyltransferase family protein n=1 Tax=unclassified Streptococcus TaxID=2608887 RepID=UPI0015B9E799|nr:MULTISPECIES: acyltransferase [unclassified Streptococcus]MCP9016209.1 acyltransferase [Streptococcus sp. CF8_St5-17]QLF56124.1 acyltransferase [Streptococcus sp. oral taxon 061]